MELTLDSENQVPAAEAFIAGLYCSADALRQLQPEQLLHAAVMADKHAVNVLRAQALDLLKKAAETQLPVVIDVLAAQSTWPSFLLPIIPAVLGEWLALDAASQLAHDQRVQAMLVAALGNLNEVWRNQEQQDVLLELPLPAVAARIRSPDSRL